MIFNRLRNALTKLYFFSGEEVEIATIYTYLGVQFSGPRFGLRKAPSNLDQQGV
jgi:hypothetical protein